MKKILIFCDGTWNSPSIAQPTHVHTLLRAASDVGDQTTLYLPGVGTGGRFSSAIGKWINKIGGGAFGWGLNRNIKVAYAALAEIYERGDQIMIFGFSRGAYTARSLAGMIRKCGLPEKSNLSNSTVNKAFRLYRKRGERYHPDKDRVWRHRRKLSPSYATSEVDKTRRGDGSHLLKIKYLGVWDTVGALGIPENLLGPIARFVNRRHQFHDTDLSSMVQSARHALALDERREFFVPSKWDNLDRNSEGAGLNAGDESAERPFQQLWFIGSHSIVGGSNQMRPLAAFALEWIADGAISAGMALKSDVKIPDVTPDATFPAADIDDPGGVYGIAPELLSWRDGPLHERELHHSVDIRLQEDSKYRPRSLVALRPDLF